MLKTAGAAFLLFLLAQTPAPAKAGTLLTGAIRDETGAAVAGASVTAFDRAGGAVGHDVAIDDGTFAIDLPDSAATLAIACDYCRTVRRTLDGSGEPLVVIVPRYTAVTQDGPSTRDIAALPYRGAADISSLRPFTVVSAGRVSDRYLDFYGATLIDGLPFYSPADGDNYSRLVPAHAIAALSVASPLVAPAYGGYASAGVYDVRLHDPDVSISRLDAGNGFDLVARSNAPQVDALYGLANDAGNRREAGVGHVAAPFAGGQLSFDALAMADAGSHASGAGISYATDSRRYATAVALTATQTGDASLVTAAARVRNNGPLALEFGFRASRATSDHFGNAAAQADGAAYVDASRRSGPLTLSASVALDRGSDSGDGGSMQAAALVGSLGSEVRLSPTWSTHSGIISNLRIPTFAETSAVAPVTIPGDRSLLFEQSLTYTDLRRLRVTGIGYTQRTTAALTRHVNGIGIDAGWQIAPRLSVQSWLLRANASATPAYVAAQPPYEGPTVASPFTRQVVWLTYDNGLRVDALVRGGALEGDLRIPLGAACALAVGSASYNGTRVTTVGVTLR